MFSGIIEELGVIEKISKLADICRLRIKAQKILSGLKAGDSIAVNGICLTATRFDALGVDFDVMQETVRKTNFRQFKVSDAVNLERAMRFDQRVGGHFITGHIDTAGRLLKKTKQGEIFYLRVSADAGVSKYIVAQGAVAVEGVSLTVAEASDKYFGVYLIPHTIASTNLKFKRAGDLLNLEADIIAKYVQRLMEHRTGPITADKLNKLGFV